ncbi:TPA: ERF family protein [Streptococcus equi subsp. zooepidemicus]|nr:ERF family protein [Streptococcus equi subsp. zooepidemicus]HEL0428316.1 ERF family protein [Streptococcus equi subsp. zooepidemicus]HEL0430467.1 ERF family protein [Streptococcus equi subsp. zooepidemicus]HEL0438558.1 ERF family protein [Streptococcus equi subsp. zooepidemicus]
MENVTIYKKLLNIQKVLNVPKGQYNKFGGYSYRNAEDILNAIKPLLWENECTAFFRKDVIEQVGDRYYLVATFDFVDVNTGEKITVEARAREEEKKKGMDASQITGSASSYARKYALNGIFLIDDAKDADTNEYQKQQKQGANTKQQTQYINDNQLQQIYNGINQLAQMTNQSPDIVASGILVRYNINDFRAVPSGYFNEVVNYIKSLMPQQNPNQINFNDL